MNTPSSDADMTKPAQSVKTAANLFVLFLFALVAFIAGRTVERQGSNADGLSQVSPTVSPSASITVLEENRPVTTESDSPTASPVTTQSSLLLVEEQKGGATRLVTFDPVSGERHIIFTDSDEPAKIKQIGGVTADGSQLLAVLGTAQDTFGGDLYLIATDGTGTKTLLANGHVSPEPPALRPDGQEIAYVSFAGESSTSNPDSGQFSLIVSDRAKTTQRTLVTSARVLTRPTYLTNQKLAYITESEDGTSGIYELDLSGSVSTPKLVINLPDMTPYDLTYRAGRYAFVDGVGSAAALFEHDVATGEVSELKHPAGPETTPLYAPDGKVIYFGNGLGDAAAIYGYTLSTGRADKVGVGLRPLGWVTKGAEV